MILSIANLLSSAKTFRFHVTFSAVYFLFCFKKSTVGTYI